MTKVTYNSAGINIDAPARAGAYKFLTQDGSDTSTLGTHTLTVTGPNSVFTGDASAHVGSHVALPPGISDVITVWIVPQGWTSGTALSAGDTMTKVTYNSAGINIDAPARAGAYKFLTQDGSDTSTLGTHTLTVTGPNSVFTGDASAHVGSHVALTAGISG